MNSKTTRQTHLSLWYTTAAVAAVGGGLACTANEAAAGVIITQSGLSAADSGSLTDTTTGIWFKLNNGDLLTGPGTSQTSNFTGAQFRLQWNSTAQGYTNLFQYSAGNTQGKSGGIFTRFYPLKLVPPGAIGPTPPQGAKWNGSAFANNSSSASTAAMNLVGSNLANWAAGATGYLALRFASPGLPAGNFNYAWAKVSIAADKQPTLVSFAYDTVPNEDPPFDYIPEPNPLLLLATGVAGLGAYRAWRARRSQRQGSSVPEGRGI